MMDDKTFDRIAAALERIAANLEFLVDEELRRLARAKARELDAVTHRAAPRHFARGRQ